MDWIAQYHFLQLHVNPRSARSESGIPVAGGQLASRGLLGTFSAWSSLGGCQIGWLRQHGRMGVGDGQQAFQLLVSASH